MTVWMFPGQGSQVKGMGKGLFNNFADLTQTANDILGYSIEELCLNDPDKNLGVTSYTQPALFVVNALTWRRYREGNPELPTALLGHSLGEYNALEAAGVIGFADGLRLVQKRGALMAEAPAGGMAAIIGPGEAEIRTTLADNGLNAIDISNFNTPSQTIVSGLKEDIARAAEVFQSDSVGFITLRTGGAFHSRYMGSAHKEFTEFLTNFSFAAPEIPVISNLFATPYEADAVAKTLAGQIIETVQWVDSIRYLLALGEKNFEELGPGSVLTRLADEIRLSTPPVQVAATQDANRNSSGLINDWNKSHGIGTEVLVEGYQGPLTTRSEAMMLFGHRAAVYLEGYNGYFELTHIRPVS